MNFVKIFTVVFLLFSNASAASEKGYKLWLQYPKIEDTSVLNYYRTTTRSGISVAGTSATMQAAAKELKTGLEGLLAQTITLNDPANTGNIIVGLPGANATIAAAISKEQLQKAGTEGFVITTVNRNGKKQIIISGNTEVGVLHGVFYFLRWLQTNNKPEDLSVTEAPLIKYRILDHWDNLNRTVERGYAGISIFNWQQLPGYIDQRYIDYARANASTGINGTVLTNVNANALVLTKDYLLKVAALAAAFRPYGIKVYLTARFSAPIEIGGLKTADPLDPAVKQWWQKKVEEIYTYIPDFGGFLVKANSEGQPGPQAYGRNHADGANMFADALKPYGGIVMWRAFVYSSETPEDRFKQAYQEFKPLDGSFRENVLIQVKNGPIDFQPREPFHPLFGAMPKTPLMMEYQLTQEYLGFATHLVYEAPLFTECLEADTYEKGKGSTVAKIIDGSLNSHTTTGMAGVANIGNEPNWTGHPFGQANWYSLGRLAWNPSLSPATIAGEWIKQTFTTKAAFVAPVMQMMLASREIMVNYMTPLGLHHIMGYSHHYGPAPWYDKAARADWNPIYFHKADKTGIGFNRTTTGTNALAQYQPGARKLFEDPATCPEAYLLWFHHISWNTKMKSGRTLWEELCYKYYTGVDSVRWMQKTWNNTKGLIDEERFVQVQQLLSIQEKEAVWWRNACVLYFQTFSCKPIPSNYEQPDHTLEYYKALEFSYAPGIGGNQ